MVFDRSPQLIDATTEAHLWAERYDRDAQDLFAVQEEIARIIAATLEGLRYEFTP